MKEKVVKKVESELLRQYQATLSLPPQWHATPPRSVIHLSAESRKAFGGVLSENDCMQTVK